MFPKKIVLFPLAIALTISCYAETLNDISTFAKSICDEVSLSGSINRSTIKAEIAGNIKPLSKLLGVKFNAKGMYTLNNTEYQGLPYDSLPEQMKDSRTCKKEISFLLLEERHRIQSYTSTSQTQYIIKDNGLGNRLFNKPNKQALFNPLSKSNQDIPRLMIGTPLNILEEQTIDSLTWYKIRVSAGTDKGKIGWVTKENIKVK